MHPTDDELPPWMEAGPARYLVDLVLDGAPRHTAPGGHGHTLTLR